MGGLILVGWQWRTYSICKKENGDEKGWSEHWTFEGNKNYIPEASERFQIREVYARGD